MRRLIVRWLLTAVPLLFGVSLLTFLLTSLVPGDPGRAILGPTATPEQVSELNSSLGLDRSLPDQYWTWLTGAVHGDFGDSLTSGAPVSSELGARLGVTAALIIGALLVAAVVGVGLGVLSAVRGGWSARVVDVVSLLGLAIPGFWLALALIELLAVRLPIFPATGYTAFAESPMVWFESLVLPVITLGFASSAPVAKQTRDGVLAELERGYVNTLRARGIPERTVILRHVLRNAAGPVITVLGLVLVGLLGTTVLVETVFVLPGLGNLVVTATAAHDIPTVQAIAVVFTLVVVTVTLLVEVLYGLLDPRVRA